MVSMNTCGARGLLLVLVTIAWLASASEPARVDLAIGKPLDVHLNLETFQLARALEGTPSYIKQQLGALTRGQDEQILSPAAYITGSVWHAGMFLSSAYDPALSRHYLFRRSGGAGVKNISWAEHLTSGAHLGIISRSRYGYVLQISANSDSRSYPLNIKITTVPIDEIAKYAKNQLALALHLQHEWA